MRIAICSRLSFAKEMIETKKKLEAMGHTPLVSNFTEDFIGVSDEQKQAMNQQSFREKDVIREFYKKIQTCDAILVLNYAKKGIENYIGGNTLMEIGFAHVHYKKIFLMNPIPEIPLYKAEIEGVDPTIIHGDLSQIT